MTDRVTMAFPRDRAERALAGDAERRVVAVGSVVGAAVRRCGLAVLALLPTDVQSPKDEIAVAPVAESAFDNHVFASGQPVTIRVQLDVHDGVQPDRVGYDVRDATDRVVAQGSAITTRDSFQGTTAELTRLPSGVGWYRIVFTRPGRPFFYDAAVDDGGHYLTYAVVPARRVGIRTSSPFGIDTALSGHSMLDGRQVVRLAALAGVGWIRDRLSLALSFPDPDHRSFEPALTNAKMARAAGISVLQVFQDSPGWLESLDGQRMPSDLRAVHDLASELATVFEGNVSAWEIWNEHDIAHFGGATPDRYAAFLKAFALGLQRHGRALRVLGPFARDPEAGNYADVLFGARVADYLDAYSFHTYHPIERESFDRFVGQHVRLARQVGFAGKRVWLTETARPLREHTRGKLEALLAQADYAVQSFVLARAAGVERLFWFLLKPYVNQAGSFGMFRRDLTPLPYYQAIAVMTHVLGEARYLGRMDHPDARIHVFDTGAEQVAVVWAARPALLRLSSARGVRVVDRLGGETWSTPVDSELEIAIGPTPLYLRDRVWTGLVHAAGEAKGPQPVTAARDLEVVLSARVMGARETGVGAGVLRVEHDGLTSDWSPRAHALPRNGRVRVDIDVFNFDDTSKSCALTFESSDTLIVEHESGVVEVGPRSTVTVPVVLRWHRNAGMSAFTRGSRPSGTLTVTGTANNTAITPTVLRFVRSRRGARTP